MQDVSHYVKTRALPILKHEIDLYIFIITQSMNCCMLGISITIAEMVPVRVLYKCEIMGGWNNKNM